MNDFNFVDYILGHGIDGDFVECGVQSGKIEKIWIERLNKFNEFRDIYMYDTFTGLTEPTEKDVGYNNNFSTSDEVLNEWKKYNKRSSEGLVNTWCYCPLEQVMIDLYLTGYPSEKLHFIKGDVMDTLKDKSKIPEKIAILRLDTDWYKSSKYELEQMFDNVVIGGIIIFDDYFYWRGQKDATDEFFKNTKYKGSITRVSDSHVAYLIK